MEEAPESFEIRKREHIVHSLDPNAVSVRSTGLEKIELLHDALPEMNLDEVDTSVKALGRSFSVPVFISSMTAGHRDAKEINFRLAQLCSNHNIAMGVGSQRRQVYDSQAQEEWAEIRSQFPDAVMLGNIGLSQLIQMSSAEVQKLADSIHATAMIVHTNPLQECLQVEGTPDFKGGIAALERVCSELEIPVILKETGSGFSKQSLNKLKSTGLYAVDVSGLGGTHWGRVEGLRAPMGSIHHSASQTFSEWGVSTFDSLNEFRDSELSCAVWASGGIRNGVDVLKCLALGAEFVGIAGPVMRAAKESYEQLELWIEQMKFEYKVALFCTGSQSLADFRERQPWQLKT